MNESLSVAANPDARSPRLWPALIEALTGRIPEPELGTLATSVSFVELADGALRVAIPSHALTGLLQGGYLETLCSAVSALTDGACTLSVVPIAEEALLLAPGRDPAHGLDRFIANPDNQLASAATRRIAQTPGEYFSPFFVAGPRGSGKSHMLRGLARALASRGATRETLCLDGESFCRELVNSTWDNKLGAFRARFRNCGALLLDNVDQLAGREASQEELAHTLDALAKEQVQVVATARLHPESVAGLSAQLAQRLSAGLVVDLSAPNWDTRIAIVTERVQAWERPISPEVASFLVGRVGNDLTQIDAILTQIFSDRGCADGLLDLARVRSALGDPARHPPQTTPETVLRVVGRHFRLRVRDLRSRARSQRFTVPRQIAIYLIRGHCERSYPEIGQLFRRHHTTALHACRVVARRLVEDEALGATIAELEQQIRAEESTESRLGRKGSG